MVTTKRIQESVRKLVGIGRIWSYAQKAGQMLLSIKDVFPKQQKEKSKTIANAPAHWRQAHVTTSFPLTTNIGVIQDRVQNIILVQYGRMKMDLVKLLLMDLVTEGDLVID